MKQQHSNWIPIICALISTLGAAYSTYLNHSSQSEIETLKTQSEQQIIKVKTDTEKEIKLAELRSHENIIRLHAQLEAEREQRSQSSLKEAEALAGRRTKCNEMAVIRDGIASDLAHLNYNDARAEAAVQNLNSAYYKYFAYGTSAGLSVIKSMLPKKESKDTLASYRDFYTAFLAGYNEEIRISCQ